MLRAEKEGITPEAADRARARASTRATSPASTSRFDNYGTHALATRTARFAEDIYGKLCARRADRASATSSSSTTRSSRCSCPTASSRASARSATPRTSTATTARSAARPTRPTDLIEPVLGGLRRRAGAQGVRALLLQAVGRALPRVPAAAGRSEAGRLQPEAAQQDAGVVRAPGLLATGTSRATRPTSASRFPARAGQVSSTSGSTRRSATSAASGTTCVRAAQGEHRRRDDVDAERARGRHRDRTTSSARTSSTSTRCSGRRC